MKSKKTAIQTVIALSLFLLVSGCTIKIEPPDYISKVRADAFSKQLLEGFKGHDTTLHVVQLPDIK
jgi:hypothetical protein